MNGCYQRAQTRNFAFWPFKLELESEELPFAFLDRRLHKTKGFQGNRKRCIVLEELVEHSSQMRAVVQSEIRVL